MEDGQEIMYQMNSDACVGPSKPEVLTVASPRVFEPMMTAAPRSDDPAVELRADATSEARARKPLQGFQSKATEKPKGELKHWQYTFAKQSLAIFCSSWLSILLPFVPAGFVVEYTHLSPLTTFAINFIAIFPVAAIVAMAMDELMMRVGNTLGVLIYMSFGSVLFMASKPHSRLMLTGSQKRCTTSYIYIAAQDSSSGNPPDVAYWQHSRRCYPCHRS
jgi:hypothetical protein